MDEDIEQNGMINKLEEISPNKSKSNAVENDVPIPEGWSRTVVQRQGGVSAGKFDIYYFSPTGKKLRSKKDVQSFCEKNDMSINIEDFKFSMGAGRGKTAITPTAVVPARKKAINATPKSTPDSPKKLKGPKKILETPTGADGIGENKKKRKRLTKTPIKVSSAGLMKAKLKSTGWVPPQSPFDLFQEKLYTNPWQLLIGSIFLNKSTNEDNVSYDFLTEFLKEWPTPEKVMKAEWEDISNSLKYSSNKEKKAKMIIKFSEEFVCKKWQYPKELHGIGKFGNDSYRVFCMNEWRKVRPNDYLLNFYVDWLFDNQVALNID